MSDLVRTQVLLTSEQQKALARLARERHKSKGALVREAVDQLLERECKKTEREKAWDDLLALSGFINSGVDDLGLNHDKYFAEAVMNPGE